MKILRLIPAIVLALAACDVPGTGPAAPTGPVQMTPVVWKENTPVATRAQDRLGCEYAAIGANPGMSEDEVGALAAQVPVDTRTVFVNRCMANKGYTITEGRVCTEADRARGQFLLGAQVDNLPSLGRVRCFAPAAGGFVVA